MNAPEFVSVCTSCGRETGYLYTDPPVVADVCASCLIRLYHDLGTLAAAQRDLAEDALLELLANETSPLDSDQTTSEVVNAVFANRSLPGEDPVARG